MMISQLAIHKFLTIEREVFFFKQPCSKYLTLYNLMNKTSLVEKLDSNENYV